MEATFRDLPDILIVARNLEKKGWLPENNREHAIARARKVLETRGVKVSEKELRSIKARVDHALTGCSNLCTTCGRAKEDRDPDRDYGFDYSVYCSWECMGAFSRQLVCESCGGTVSVAQRLQFNVDEPVNFRRYPWSCFACDGMMMPRKTTVLCGAPSLLSLNACIG